MMERLLQRLSTAETRLAKLEEKRGSNGQEQENKAVRRVRSDLLKHGIYSSRFFFVPSNYYDLPLEDRATLLNGNTSQLCKSILFENTVWNGGNEFERGNARYYCVIIQYIGKTIA